MMTYGLNKDAIHKKTIESKPQEHFVQNKPCTVNSRIYNITTWLTCLCLLLFNVLNEVLCVWVSVTVLTLAMFNLLTVHEAACGPLGDVRGRDGAPCLPSPPVHPDSSVKNVKQQPSLVHKAEVPPLSHSWETLHSLSSYQRWKKYPHPLFKIL